jgi:hypothetical protein
MYCEQCGAEITEGTLCQACQGLAEPDPVALPLQLMEELPATDPTQSATSCSNAPPSPSASPPPADEPEPCKGHVWERGAGDTPAQTIAKNEAQYDRWKTKKGKEGAIRGYLFENKSIQRNMDVLGIQATSVLYRCTNKGCKQTQEVDIVGRDRIAESKSRNLKQVSSKGAQRQRLKEISQQCFNDNKPLAKLDGDLDDSDQSRDYYAARGFDTEIVQ